ncbi:MAG: aspartyl/asparaginyl beta-hydroxylase domain-containing protein [Pyrinomonadaceae bacterium]|nr:aspartyl/asparaginyl beta-hydroxylase domain-containing protein [Pyrinomonadaceae bacterium]
MSIRSSKAYRYTRKAIKILVPVSLGLYFIPKTLIVFFALGLLDASRNRPLNFSVLFSYFFGNGVLTWLLAPFNLLLDLLSLPYRNRGIYQLDDLPAEYREEIEETIAIFKRNPELIDKIVESSKRQERTMVFFRWYGRYSDKPFELSEFDRPFKYLRSAGISVFNKKSSTGLHFGPLRVTIRVLYNLNKMRNDDVFIEVGDYKQKWKDDPLFIFDDTLRHRSVNESGELRVCVFADVLRPSLVPIVFSSIVRIIRTIFKRANFLFYKNWKLLK